MNIDGNIVTFTNDDINTTLNRMEGFPHPIWPDDINPPFWPPNRPTGLRLSALGDFNNLFYSGEATLIFDVDEHYLLTFPDSLMNVGKIITPAAFFLTPTSQVHSIDARLLLGVGKVNIPGDCHVQDMLCPRFIGNKLEIGRYAAVVDLEANEVMGNGAIVCNRMSTGTLGCAKSYFVNDGNSSSPNIVAGERTQVALPDYKELYLTATETISKTLPGYYIRDIINYWEDFARESLKNEPEVEASQLPIGKFRVPDQGLLRTDTAAKRKPYNIG
jgi:hypothetical protein